MSTAIASREARRRKILERGSQRLDLITGRIQDFPSAPSISPPQLSSQPSDSLTDSKQPPLIISPQSNVSPDADDKVFSSMLPEQSTVADARQLKADNGGSSVGPSLNELEPSVSEASSQRKSSTVASAMQSSLGSSSASGQSVVRDISFKTIFTPYQIKSAIVATEKFRLICSATVAILVVLSCLGFPLMGSYVVKGVITFRPLFLVLLTNITFVLAQLLLGNEKGFDRSGKVLSLIPTTDEYDWTDHLSKFLEAALLMQKVLDAVFMDCSVYSLIIISGLALAYGN